MFDIVSKARKKVLVQSRAGTENRSFVARIIFEKRYLARPRVTHLLSVLPAISSGPVPPICTNRDEALRSAARPVASIVSPCRTCRTSHVPALRRRPGSRFTEFHRVRESYLVRLEIGRDGDRDSRAQKCRSLAAAEARVRTRGTHVRARIDDRTAHRPHLSAPATRDPDTAARENDEDGVIRERIDARVSRAYVELGIYRSETEIGIDCATWRVL